MITQENHLGLDVLQSPMFELVMSSWIFLFKHYYKPNVKNKSASALHGYG